MFCRGLRSSADGIPLWRTTNVSLETYYADTRQGKKEKKTLYPATCARISFAGLAYVLIIVSHHLEHVYSVYKNAVKNTAMRCI